jgi:Asp-tRNA(Asn)/Glu-tRNA(Gln) amidotransferase B subunit
MSATAFHSVKLPADLIDQARTAAVVFRRSTAAQIEYWAVLGQAVEESGITVKEAKAVVAPPADAASSDQVADLIGEFVAFDRSTELARHVRQVIAANAAKAASAQYRMAA